MPQDNSAEMTKARFAALVEAYGGDPARWPFAEREAAQRWLASNPAAQALLTQAANLDRAMGDFELPAVSTILERRLLEDFDRVLRRWSVRRIVGAAANAVWPGAPVWQPACALGLALAAGLSIALFAPFDIPQQEDVSSSVFALDTGPDVDAGHGI